MGLLLIDVCHLILTVAVLTLNLHYPFKEVQLLQSHIGLQLPVVYFDPVQVNVQVVWMILKYFLVARYL